MTSAVALEMKIHEANLHDLPPFCLNYFISMALTAAQMNGLFAYPSVQDGDDRVRWKF